MRRILAMCAVIATVATAHAAPTDPVDPRMEAIWSAALNRTSDQIDRWFEAGDFPRCLHLLRVLYEIRPDDYDAATDLGYMLKSTEAFDEELAVYVRFRKENPKDADAPFPEANFYFERKVYAKVPALLEPTLKLKPHGNSYRRLAHSYERLGLVSDAARVWHEFLNVSPADEPAKNNLKRVQGMMRSDGGD